MNLKSILLAAFVCLGVSPSSAHAWPRKPLSIVVGFAAGGDTDVVARIYADKLSNRLGQPVLVENKPGASGMIAAAYVAKAAPDGYTLMNVASTFAIAPHVLKSSAATDAVKDFSPIFQISKAPLVVVTSPTMKLSGIPDLIREARSNGQLSYASPGIGSPMHLLAEQFLRSARISMAHIPYKGNSQVISDSIAGHVTVGWTGLASANPQISDGKLLALAVTTPERSGSLPHVPTFVELGFPDVSFVSWMGFLGPKGMPSDLVQMLNKHLNEITEMPDVRAKLAALGLEPVGGPPAVFETTVRTDYERLGTMVQESEIKLD